jgi:hypothetical protein
LQRIQPLTTLILRIISKTVKRCYQCSSMGTPAGEA